MLGNLGTAVENGATRTPMITVFTNGFVLRGQLTSEHWFRETSLEHRRQNLEGAAEYKKADAGTRQSLMQQLQATSDALVSTGEIRPL